MRTALVVARRMTWVSALPEGDGEGGGLGDRDGEGAPGVAATEVGVPAP